MKKMYNVMHYYDVDGGFGDAVERSELIATFENENDAKAFVEKYNNPHVYDNHYSDLYEGNLEISEIEVVTHKDFDIERLGFELLNRNVFSGFDTMDIRDDVLYRNGKPFMFDSVEWHFKLKEQFAKRMGKKWYDDEVSDLVDKNYDKLIEAVRKDLENNDEPFADDKPLTEIDKKYGTHGTVRSQDYVRNELMGIVNQLLGDDEPKWYEDEDDDGKE